MIQGIAVKGEYTTFETGDYTYTVNTQPTNGNDVASLEWELEENVYASIKSYGGNTCTIEVKSLGDEETAPTAKLTCRLTMSDGTVFEGSIEINLYARSAQLGDLVFADGTYGTELVEGKTVVGVCFYINPTDPTDRRMSALDYLWHYMHTDRCGASWGLQKSGYGYTTASYELADEPSYNCYDTPVANITTDGLGNYGKEFTAEQNWGYIDDATDDGFKHNITENTFIDDGIANPGVFDGRAELTADLVNLTTGEKTGTRLPTGRIKTLQIIKHRNKILTDSGTNKEVPAASENETELAAVRRCMNASSPYTIYYPAPSFAYAYQPVVTMSEKLSEKFKAHNWYLMSSGEAMRIFWAVAYGENYTDKIGNIYANAIKLLGVKKATPWRFISKQGLMTSTEIGSNDCVKVSFSRAYLETYVSLSSTPKANPAGNLWGYGVVPVCQF